MIKWPRLQLVTMIIIGHPRTGKTTLAWRLVHKWKRLKRNYRPIAVYARVSCPDDIHALIDYAVEAARVVGARAVGIVFDDVTYVLGNDKESRKIMNRLLQLAHEAPQVRWWLVTHIIHYFKSLPPAVRAANIKILTSIDPTWIPSLKEAFLESALWDYWEAWRNWMKPGLSLVNNMGEHYILKWTKPVEWEPPWIDVTEKIQTGEILDRPVDQRQRPIGNTPLQA